MKARNTVVLAVLFAALCAASVNAQTVLNPSFESAVTLTNGTWESGTIPNWVISAGGSAGISQLSLQGLDGTQLAWINNGSISQDLGPAQSGFFYTLTVAVANRGSWSTSTVTIALGNCSQTVNVAAIPVGTFADQVLTCAAPGELLITFSTPVAQGDFDNVRLTGGPPPVSVSMSPSSAAVPIGQTATFTATVTGDSTNAGVNWTVSAGTASPSSTPSGSPTTYTAPSAPGPATLTACSVAAPAVCASASINVPHQVALSWTASTTQGVTYNVYRSNGATWNPVLLANVTATSYTDTTIVFGSNYVYKVTATLSGVESEFPSPVTVVTQ